MGLNIKFNELNNLADELSSTIYNIYENYLNNDFDFPYRAVMVLENKYNLMRKQVYKSKYSKINEILYNFSLKKKEDWQKLNAPTIEEIFCKASENVLPEITSKIDKYTPVDDKSKKDISDRLIPIIKNLKLNSITELYREFKRFLSKKHTGTSDVKWIYLQELFVGFIITKLSHNQMNKYSRSHMMYTYEEVCKRILKEPVLSIDKTKAKNK